jgi:two-component system response regulator HydG
MFTLIADRFVCNSPSEGSSTAQGFSLAALDLATGDRVRLRIAAAQSRADQQAWVESCARAYGAGTLVDFGFIGTDRRFEAVSLINGRRGPHVSSPPATVLDWIDNYKPSSTRILRLSELPDARDLRLRGFVPIRLSLLHDSSLSRVWAILGGRSVVLLDSCCAPRHLALAMLKCRDVHVSDMCALSRQSEIGCAAVANAAEGRAAYEPAPVISGGRAAGMLADGERLRAAGRHAGAERSLRAAIAAFDRRNDAFHAGESEMSLGRLLLTRGRATHARALFESAHNRFQRVGAALPALVATAELGIAQTDLKLFSEGERSCRAAHSAASALLDADATLLSVIALARALFWQERYAEAQALVESLQPASDGELRTRYWCLVARLRLVRNDVAGAWRAVGQARPASRGSAPAIECLVRTWEAAVQARLGDLEALDIHARAGLAAARAAHLPLRAIKLRLTCIEGYIDADNLGRARTAGTHLRALSDSSLPPLLKMRVDRALARANGLERRAVGRPSTISAHEAAVGFHSRLAATTVDDLDGVSELLSLSHQYEDEAEALSRAAASIRKHTHALGLGIFGCVEGDARPLGSAGTANAAIARRSFDAGMAVGPEASTGGVDAAVPIRYLGRPVGALAMRWTVEGPEQADRALAFWSAAAAACAPLVYVLLERQRAPARDDSAFDLIGSSAAMNDVRQAVRRAASAPFTVLIEGECGSGKELVANAIHRAGCRRERRFCAFNCAAMPEDLVDAELFGHAKGAFTGAAGERLGLFESADGGTVFLDEVGELSARAQAKILRVLQEGEIRRIGENFTRRFDARLVAATNRPLRAEVDAGRFRQDLLYRLDVIRIVVPPLRERVEDIPLLASRFWRQSAERIGSKAVLGQSAISALARYDWPGNVRELQNVLTALVVAVPSRGVVGASQMPAAIARAAQPASHESLESARVKFEQRFVRAALARAAGHRGQTAAALGLTRQGLAKLMQRLHLDA